MSSNISTRTNVRVLLYGPKDLRIEESQIAYPGPGEAQVEIKATGLCGSDLHYYVHARNGNFIHHDPAVLGHESAGLVTAVGEDVINVKVGDRVAIEGGIKCGKCRLCNEGRYNLCPDMRYFSSAKSKHILHGTLQSHINHPANLLYTMPENVTYEQGSLVEPLSICLHASRRAPLSPGQTALIIGAGSMGILQAALSNTVGASSVVIIDIAKDRVDFAVKEGFASHGYVLERGEKPKSVEEAIDQAQQTASKLVKQFLGDGVDGFDVVYECTGVEPSMHTAIYAARPGGKVAIVGMGLITPIIPLAAAAFREIDIIGVMRSKSAYAECLALLDSGRLPGIGRLVMARYPLHKTEEAFQTLARGRDEQGNFVVKVMVGAKY